MSAGTYSLGMSSDIPGNADRRPPNGVAELEGEEMDAMVSRSAGGVTGKGGVTGNGGVVGSGARISGTPSSSRRRSALSLLDALYLLDAALRLLDVLVDRERPPCCSGDPDADGSECEWIIEGVALGFEPTARSEPFLGGRGAGDNARKWLDDVEVLGGGVNDELRGGGAKLACVGSWSGSTLIRGGARTCASSTSSSLSTSRNDCQSSFNAVWKADVGGERVCERTSMSE